MIFFLLVSLAGHSLNIGYSGKVWQTTKESSIHAGLRRDASQIAAELTIAY